MSQKRKTALLGLTVVCVLVAYLWLGRFECFGEYWFWPEHRQFIERHTFRVSFNWFRFPLAFVIGGAMSAGLYQLSKRFASDVTREVEDVIEMPRRIREIRDEQKKDKKP